MTGRATHDAAPSTDWGMMSFRLVPVLVAAFLVSCSNSETSNVIADVSLASAAEETLEGASLVVEMDFETTEVVRSEDGYEGQPYESQTVFRLDRVGDRTDMSVESTLGGTARFWVDGDRMVAQGSQGVVDYIAGTPSTSIADDLDLMANIIATSSSEILSEDDRERTYALDCSDRVIDLLQSQYLVVCHPDATTTATVERTTGRLLSISHEGPYPLFPGFVVRARGTISYGTDPVLDSDPPFDEADTGPLTCVANELDLEMSEVSEISDRISSNTTVQNGELFAGCGFDFYPPGNDLIEELLVDLDIE